MLNLFLPGKLHLLRNHYYAGLQFFNFQESFVSLYSHRELRVAKMVRYDILLNTFDRLNLNGIKSC